MRCTLVAVWPATCSCHLLLCVLISQKATTVHVHAPVVRPAVYLTVLEQHRSFKGFAHSVAQQEYPREAILGSGYELKSKATSVGVAKMGDLGNLFLYYYLCACVGESVKYRHNCMSVFQLYEVYFPSRDPSSRSRYIQESP